MKLAKRELNLFFSVNLRQTNLNKMKKYSFLLVFVFGLLFVSCGGGEATDETTATEEVDSTATGHDCEPGCEKECCKKSCDKKCTKKCDHQCDDSCAEGCTHACDDSCKKTCDKDSTAEGTCEPGGCAPGACGHGEE